MKIRLFTISLLVSIVLNMNLTSCGALPVPPTLTPTATTASPTITPSPTPTIEMPFATPYDHNTPAVSRSTLSVIKLGFIEPDPSTFVKILPSLVEYFYYKKQAMIAGDPEILWKRYPDLKQGEDIYTGINTEAWTIGIYNSLDPFDGNMIIEYYERFKVKDSGNQIEVFIHGLELYTFINDNKFQDSGGEFKIFITLVEQDGNLTVIKTDRVTQAEWQQFSQ